MAKSLDEVKRYLSTKYLGEAGIHSIGISRNENAVRIYLEPDTEGALRDILPEIEKEAAPYKVVTIKSDRSSIT